MIRYQVRSEYGLADPELYAPGEKDDPEALLEGVAMAGLVGVLRQLGDLAEFAAEIFHDLHEDVMATASRGHGLMLRLQQLEAEFPAVEKAIISQADHSNYPHDDGVEWHANIQLNQNMITRGDMPRFILDSYEECRGPPHLFTLDKFDVAGAGASLKRYTDPSLFKTEHASNMIETDGVREKKPRKIKKKAMRWRKGETLESLLVQDSESQNSSSKDRNSRKVPPRTTKLKPRHPWDSDHRAISRICREQLQEVISSQQKILLNYSSRHYYAKFRSADSSETASSFGELDNSNAPVQSSAKIELTKVVPVNEYDTVETASTLIKRSVCLDADDEQSMATQHGLAEVEDVCERSLVGENGISVTAKRLHESTDFKGEDSNCALQPVREEENGLGVVPVDHDDDYCKPDDIGSDQDNFADALNIESEGEADHQMKTKWDLSANKLNCHSEEGENALHVQFSELDHAIDLSSGLKDSCNGGETTCADSYLVSGSSFSAASDGKDPDTDSTSVRELSGVNWTNDKEPFNDDDLMNVSSSSSVLSHDSGNCEINDYLNGCEQKQEAAFLSCNDYQADGTYNSDNQSPRTSSGLDGLANSSNDYPEKAYRSVENGQNFGLDDTSVKFGQPNDVFHGDEETEVGDDDDLLLCRNLANQEQIHINEQLEEHTFLDASTSPGKLASLPDMGPVVHLNNLELDNVIFPEEEIVTNAMPTGLYPDDIHMHLDELDSGVTPIHSSIPNDPLYESHDDEIVEEWHCVRDEDLYKHAAEDQVGLEKRPCLTRVNTHNEDATQESVGPRHVSTFREIPRVSESISPPQDDGEAHVGEMLAPSPYVLNDETELLLIGGLAPSTASLLESSSSSVKHSESNDIEKIVKCGEVAEELATSRSEDDMIPCEQDCSVRAKYTEKAEVSATNCTEENSRHDVRMHSISPCREDLETVEATCANIGSLDESGEHIFNESMLQTDNFPQLTEIETSGETYSGGDDTRYVSSLHFPEESVWQEKIPEETSPHDLDKDGAVRLRSDMFGEQQSHVDQDSVTELSAQDSFSTNPFMDPGCTVSNTQTVSSPSMRYQPCLSEEEQDFLSEILINHGNTSAKEDPYPLADSLWESATPPDEAPLPSEVMTEEDFRSFCHEYNEMDFTAVTEGLDNKPSSDSNGITNGCVDNEVGFPSVSAPSAGLDQEVVCCNSDSQLAEGSSGTDIPGETLMPFSAKEDPDGETPVVDSDLYSHELSGNEKIPEVDRPSVPVELEQEQHSLPEVASHGGSYLLDNDKIGEIYGSSLGNVVPVKEEQEPCTNLTISEKLENLGVPPSNSQQVEPVVEGNGLDESCYQGMTCSSINDEIEELHVLSLSKPVPTQELEVCPLGELNAQIVPSSLIDKTTDDLEAPSLRTALEEKQDPEDGMSGEHDSQICASLVSEKTDELDTPPPSNVVLMENEPEVCAPCETDSHIASCSLRNEKIYELVGPPLSGSVLEKIESENHSSGDDSQITPSVNDKIDGLDAATSINDLQVEPEWETCAPPVEWESCAPPVELGWEACASPAELEWEACSPPKLDSQIAPCSLYVDKFGQLDGPSSCNVRLESENGSDCSPEFDSHTTPCSSDSHVLAETLTVICTSVKPITEDNYRLSPVPPPIEPSPSVSYENPQKPPPLPPIQWRLGRPRLGLLNTEGHIPDPVKGTNPFLPASSQEVDYSSLNGTTGSIPAVSSQEIKESYQNPMVENSDQRVESGRSSTLPAVTDVVRTEHDRPLSEACENINHQRHTSSSSIETEQHLNVTGVTDGTALHQLNLSLPLSTYEHGMDQKGPQLHILYSDTADSSDHLRHTDPVACEDDKMMDGHNATDGVHSYAMTSSTPGQVSENGCYQHALNDDSFSETSDNKEHSSNESYEEKNLKDESMTNGAPSDTTEHTGPDSMLEERNSQESRNFQEQNAENPKNDQSKPSAKSMVSQDPHDDHIGRRDNVHHPSQIVLQPGDTNKYVGDLGEAEQPPVLGWTVGPQMLHPNYASMGAFEPEAADHRLTRKPISMRNIPRNPLVDAVAAHDRSTMRKVSEIAPATDEAKPKDRNLLLEQIRNKTFDLKPVGSAKPASVRASARASSRNLKVAAIIEKANAIRQAVGSDDEDKDNWSDT